MSVFKSYLRQLLRRLQELEQAQKAGDMEKAATIIRELIKDTQHGVADD